MKPEEIKLNDWVRIFFGNVPPEFYLELVIRAFFIYLLLMICMRLMGKSMQAQISNVSLAALVAMASAIGVPMLTPDRGLLPAYIVGLVVVGITKLIESLGVKKQRFEAFAQGEIDVLVEEAVMNYAVMKKVRISRERLFAQLRSQNIDHLGMVKRLYMEANGSFSLIENEEKKPGLMVLPDWDKDFVSRKLETTSTTICKNCGAAKPENLTPLNGKETCLNCGNDDWTKAVVEKQPVA